MKRVYMQPEIELILLDDKLDIITVSDTSRGLTNLPVDTAVYPQDVDPWE